MCEAKQNADQNELLRPLLHAVHNDMQFHARQTLSVVLVHLLQRRLSTAVSALEASARGTG